MQPCLPPCESSLTFHFMCGKHTVPPKNKKRKQRKTARLPLKSAQANIRQVLRSIFMSHSSADGLLQNRQPDVLDYGFIVRYPSYGEKQTGIPYEPWHLRYVGLPHSQIIMDEYLTLEEYIDLLKLGSFYQYGSYLISHQNGRVIDAPSGWKHVTVSEDNLGGYLFTWEL